MNSMYGDPNAFAGGIIPTQNRDNGLSLNFLGDITIIQQQDLSQPRMPNMAQMGMVALMMQQQNNALMLEQEKLKLEKEKLKLASLAIESNVSNEPVKEISNGRIETGLDARLEAEDIEYKILDNNDDCDDVSSFKTKLNNIINDDWIPEIEIKETDYSIYKTLLNIKDEDIISDLNKQKTEKSSPKLFSNKDGESVVVSFILLDNMDWRNSVKKSILKANEFPVANFFKDRQEYLFFLYSNENSIKANSAILITPTSVNKFLKLNCNENDVNTYDELLLKHVCEKYTDEVYLLIEPVVPSSSKITKLFGKDDFKYSYTSINPLYSKSINKVDISLNLASKSIKRIK